jgi:hypothetical protein
MISTKSSRTNAAPALQHAEQKHPPRMIEKQIIPARYVDVLSHRWPRAAELVGRLDRRD